MSGASLMWIEKGFLLEFIIPTKERGHGEYIHACCEPSLHEISRNHSANGATENSITRNRLVFVSGIMLR